MFTNSQDLQVTEVFVDGYLTNVKTDPILVACEAALKGVRSVAENYLTKGSYQVIDDKVQQALAEIGEMYNIADEP